MKANRCHSPNYCISCLSCYYACPYAARSIVYVERPREQVRIYVDTVEHVVDKYQSLMSALESLGYGFKRRGL